MIEKGKDIFALKNKGWWQVWRSYFQYVEGSHKQGPS